MPDDSVSASAFVPPPSTASAASPPPRASSTASAATQPHPATSAAHAASGAAPIPPDHRFAFQRLDVYVAARELAGLVHSAPISDAELRDQATRAAKSCFLALAEGLPHESPGQRGRYFSTAHASLCECVAALDLAAAVGALGPARAAAAAEVAARVRRMLTALRRPGARVA